MRIDAQKRRSVLRGHRFRERGTQRPCAIRGPSRPHTRPARSTKPRRVAGVESSVYSYSPSCPRCCWRRAGPAAVVAALARAAVGPPAAGAAGPRWWTTSLSGSPSSWLLVNLTGTDTQYPDGLAGAKAAVKGINSRGGINGHRYNSTTATFRAASTSPRSVLGSSYPTTSRP